MKFWLKDPLRDKAVEGNDGGGGGGDKSGDVNQPPVDDKNKGGDHKAAKETEAALALYRALQDPDISGDVIENLARRAGLLDRDKNRRSKDSDDDRPGESRAAKKLREKLGKDYEKFADTVGPAFDELIAEAVNELRSHSTAERETDRWASQVDKFMESHELTEEIEDKMKELMEDSPPNTGRRGFDSQKYLTRMYKNACEELDIEVPKPKGKSRREDSDDNDTPRFVLRDRPKGATLDDAVEAAMRGIKFKR